MECKEFQSYISAAVDECLPPQHQRGFKEHANACPRCRRAYQLELTTKRLVHDHLSMVKTPGAVAASILDRLHGGPPLRPAVSASKPFWRSRVLYATGTLAVAASIVALLLIREPSAGVRSSTVPSEFFDILEGSRAHYHAVVAGGVQPQVVSQEMRDVESFFSGKVPFSLVLPAIPNVRTIGGAVNEHGGTKLVHLVYGHEKSPIYINETCWRTVQAGVSLNLPSYVIDALKQSGRYIEEGSDGTTSVIWTHGGTVCIAVSNMPRADLVATLDTGFITHR